MLAGLISAAAGLKGKGGKALTAEDFDIYNRTDAPPEELTVDRVKRMLAGNR